MSYTSHICTLCQRNIHLHRHVLSLQALKLSAASITVVLCLIELGVEFLLLTHELLQLLKACLLVLC